MTRLRGQSRGNTRAYVLQDWETNKPAAKTRVLLAFYRLAQVVRGPLATPTRIAYRFFSDWGLGIELNWEVRAGPGLRVDHGHGMVIHPEVVLGARCKLRHGVTIGQAVRGGPVPRIGDDVDFGVGAIVLGGITVGDGAMIGAAAVVTKDVPPRATMAGNPARIIGVAGPLPPPARS